MTTPARSDPMIGAWIACAERAASALAVIPAAATLAPLPPGLTADEYASILGRYGPIVESPEDFAAAIRVELDSARAMAAGGAAARK